MSKFLAVCGVCAMAAALLGCGKPAAPATPAAGAGAAAAPTAAPAADECTYKCGGCGKTANGKKAGPAPDCCGKPMTAS